MSSAAVWDGLHQQARHQVRYPSEHAIRFLVSVRNMGGQDVLDIGCGFGRHMRAAAELGLVAVGVDVSETAVEHAGEYGVTHCASMTSLPFADDVFDGVLSYGVFYYAAPAETEQAIGEMHRVLRPGGTGLVNVRTPRDWRAQHIRDGVFDCPGEPEHGLPFHVLAEDEITAAYGMFNVVRYELAETTFRDRTRRDSDWLIRLQK